MFKLNNVRKVFKKLYYDKLSVRRAKNELGADFTIDTDYPTSYVYINVPCRLSRIVPDQSKAKTESLNEFKSAYRIFYDIDVDIRKGDLLEVTRVIRGVVEKTYTAIAGDPMLYDTHCEVEILIDGDA